MRVIYPALEKLPSFKVINAKEQAKVARVAVHNDVLVADVYRSDEKPIEWHRVTETGLAKDFTIEKKEIDQTINGYETDKGLDVHEGPLSAGRLQAEFANMGGRKDGLWIFRKGKNPELIGEVVFGRPVLCSGGEWVVVAKTPP